MWEHGFREKKSQRIALAERESCTDASFKAPLVLPTQTLKHQSRCSDHQDFKINVRGPFPKYGRAHWNVNIAKHGSCTNAFWARTRQNMALEPLAMCTRSEATQHTCQYTRHNMATEPFYYALTQKPCNTCQRHGLLVSPSEANENGVKYTVENEPRGLGIAYKYKQKRHNQKLTRWWLAQRAHIHVLISVNISKTFFYVNWVQSCIHKFSISILSLPNSLLSNKTRNAMTMEFNVTDASEPRSCNELVCLSVLADFNFHRKTWISTSGGATFKPQLQNATTKE